MFSNYQQAGYTGIIGLETKRVLIDTALFPGQWIEVNILILKV
jgi:hypothetical protein